jgi:hypothetical protein
MKADLEADARFAEMGRAARATRATSLADHARAASGAALAAQHRRLARLADRRTAYANGAERGALRAALAALVDAHNLEHAATLAAAVANHDAYLAALDAELAYLPARVPINEAVRHIAYPGAVGVEHDAYVAAHHIEHDATLVDAIADLARRPRDAEAALVDATRHRDAATATHDDAYAAECIALQRCDERQNAWRAAHLAVKVGVTPSAAVLGDIVDAIIALATAHNGVRAAAMRTLDARHAAYLACLAADAAYVATMSREP